MQNLTLNWPQIVLLILIVMTMLIHAKKHGETREWNIYANLFDEAILIIILYFGGFFTNCQ
jgi:hypothetical protein